MGSVTLDAPDGAKLNVPFTGAPPSPADIQQIMHTYETAQAREANAANIARAQAIPNGPDSESAAGYLGGLGANFAETGQDIARGAPLLGPNIVSSAKALPGKLTQGMGELGDAVVDTAVNRAAPVGAPRIGMSGAQANKIALAAPQSGVSAVHEAATGGRSLPDQYIQAFANDPASTTLATAGAFTGVGDALGLAGGIAEGAGVSGLADGLAANAASAKFFGDPANIAGAINSVAMKVNQAKISAAIRPEAGDFVQSGANPNVFGRVVSTEGAGITKSYVVDGPNGPVKVGWADISRHAPASEVDSVVAANPGAERVFGAPAGGGYRFTPEYKWSAEETPNPEPESGPIIVPQPSAIMQGDAAAERYAPSSAMLPGRTQAALQDNSLYTEGDQSGRYFPSSIRPTPTGPTSTSTPRTAGLLENRTLGTGNGDILNSDRGQSGTFLPSGDAPQAPPSASAAQPPLRLLTAPAAGPQAQSSPSMGGGPPDAVPLNGQNPLPQAPIKPLYDMATPDLQEQHLRAIGDEKAIEREVFGDDGAAKYRQLQRISNSGYADKETIKAADAQLQAMEDALTPAQQKRLFGEAGVTDTPLYSPEDIAGHIRARAGINDDTPETLGQSISNALITLSEISDPARMTYRQQVALGVLKTAQSTAVAKGYDPAVITRAAYEDAARQLGSRQEASEILPGLQPPEAPPAAMTAASPSKLQSPATPQEAPAFAGASSVSAPAPMPGYGFKKTERGFVMAPDTSAIEDAAAQMRNLTSGNLHMMERHLSSKAVNAAREVEAAPGKTAAIMHGPMQQSAHILRPIGGAEVLPEMLTSSNLRGVADRWYGLAADAQTKPVYHQTAGGAAVLDPTFESHLKTLEAAAPHRFGKVSDKAKSLAAQAGETGNDKPLRDLLHKTLTEAGDVATVSARSIVPDGKFQALSNDARYVQAEGLFKAHVESVLAASHASNDGVFRASLGPRNTHYPLQPTDMDGNPVHNRIGAGRPEFVTPTNRSNQFATGQSADYDTSMAAFRSFTQGSLRRNAQAALMKQLISEHALQPETNGVPEADHRGLPTGLVHMTLPNGSTHVAQSVPVNMQGDKMIAPKWLVDELGPILHRALPGWGAQANFGPLTGVANVVNAIGLAGPMTMMIHAENVISVVAHELAASSGIPGVVLNAVPLAQRIHTVTKMLRVDPSSPQSMARISEMAKAGVIPSEYGAATFSKQQAEDVGARLAYPEKGAVITKTSAGRAQVHGVSVSPVLFGRNGLDIRARLILWNIARDAAGVKPGDSMVGPNGQWKDPGQALAAAKIVERVGRYVPGLESKFVRAMKQSGMGPTATAATTMAGNAARYWLNPAAFAKGAALSVLSWILVHKAITGRYPWQDHNSRFGYIPFHYKGQVYYADYLSIVNTLYARGARVTGIAGAYNAKVHGGGARQIADAAALGPINAGLHLAAGGPAASTIFRAATLSQPYATHTVDKRTGRPSLGLIPAVDKVRNTATGLAIARTQAALEGASPITGMVEQGAGVGMEGRGSAKMPPEMRAASMVSQMLGTPIRTRGSSR